MIHRQFALAHVARRAAAPVLLLCLCTVALVASWRPVSASAFVVTTTADAGPGSLRQAMLDAEQNANLTDSITFDIPAGEAGCTAANVCTITLESGLPPVEDPKGLIIDGNGADITISGDNQYRHLVVGNNSDATTVTISKLTLIDGYSENIGGSIFVQTDARLNVNDTTFTGNVAGSSGGAIFSGYSDLHIHRSTFVSNEAETGFGGAIHGISDVNVYNSTFYQNQATEGGAIFAYSGEVFNNTFHDNTAFVLRGGGLRRRDDIVHDPKLELRNNIFSENTGGNCSPALSPNFHNSGGNLSSDDTCTGTVTTPLLLDTTLRDNGGPTQTLALLPGSPAIDYASGSSCITTAVDEIDQRGLPRNVNVPGVGSDTSNVCDSGAYESQGDEAFLTVSKVTVPAGGTGFPFVVDPSDYTFAFKWGVGNYAPNPPAGTFDEPIGVAIDPDGNVFVADADNDRIQKFDANGNIITSWGIFGSGNGEFRHPWGVAVDSEGRVYVIDTQNLRVQRFSNDGAYQTQWGESGGGAGQFAYPLSLTTGPKGRVYVADSDNNRIQVFTSSGGFVMAFGKDVVDGGGTGYEICLPADICKAGAQSNEPGSMIFPTDVAVDAAGNIFVVDQGNHRIQKFDSAGNYLTEWGTLGNGNGQFGSPYGVAVDAAGAVYVTDTGNIRVQKFTGDGQFIAEWGSGGSGDGQFNTVRGIDVSPSGRVYVGDTFNDRIQVFETDGAFTLDDGQSMSMFVPLGTARISELVPPGWGVPGIDCDSSEPNDLDGAMISLTLTAPAIVNCQFTNAPAPEVETAVYISVTTAGTTGDGVQFGGDDILKYDGDVWSIWFNGSAEGLMVQNAVHNINAFWIEDEEAGSVIMSFAQNRRAVPGIAVKVDGTDLVRWDGSAFSFYFDGSDVGLTKKTAEKIDGLHVLEGNTSPINGGACLAYLLISTQGPGKVPNHSGGTLKFGGEDVLGFCATGLGEDTAGLWHLVVDGSADGLPKNVTDSISLSDDGSTLYLTTKKAINVGNVTGGHSMVYAYDMAGGDFSGPLFKAADEGLPKKVDGLHVTGEIGD